MIDDPETVAPALDPETVAPALDPERIVKGARRPDVVNAACIRNGMSEEEIAKRIDAILTAMGE